MNDESWLGLLLLLGYSWKAGNLVSSSDEEKQKRFIMENCPLIEYEQDMGAHIPFCRMNNEPCNMQCLERK